MNKKSQVIIIAIVITLVLVVLLINFMPKDYSESVDSLDNRTIGFEYLDSNGSIVNEANAEVVHMWNAYKYEYYFNKSSGIQFSNYFDESWTHNIFCAGYKNASNDWVYDCNDKLSFNFNIKTDNLTYVNYTLWRDKTIGSKTVRLGLRYHLKLNDKNLSVQLSVENIGSSDINNDLGFAWVVNDIKINNDSAGDFIFVNYTNYNLSDDLHENFTNLDNSYYRLFDSAYVQLDWNNNLNYKLEVKNVTNQENARVSLGINVGSLSVGQIKSTTMNWKDPVIFEGFATGNTTALTDTMVWNQTITCGNNMILIVGVAIDSEPTALIDTVTYNGTSLSKTNSSSSSDSEVQAEMWNLTNPDCGETLEINVTFTNPTAEESAGISSVYYDVNQINISSVNASHSDGSSTSSLSVETTNENQWVVNILALDFDAGSGISVSGDNATQIGFSDEGVITTALAIGNDSDGEVNMDWSGFDDEWVQIGVSLIPSSIVEWNQSTFDFGDVLDSTNATIEIDSFKTNTNVKVDCVGNCTEITSNWTTRTMTDGQSDVVLLTCSNSTEGVFQATFNVTSDEDTLNSSITVDCEVFSYGVLVVNLTVPNDDFNVTQNTTFELNATVNCTGGANARCGTVEAYARYNKTTATPDTFVNITEGGNPFYISGDPSTQDADLWNLNVTSFVNEYALGGGIPRSFFIDDSGTRLYLNDFNSNVIEEFTMSTPWDITSSSLLNNVFHIHTGAGIFMKSDGSKVYQTHLTAFIGEANLTTPWNISTKIDAIPYDTGLTVVKGLSIDDSGTRMYVISSEGKIHEFTMSIPWDITSSSLTESSAVVSSSPRGLFVDDSGTRIYIIDNSADKILQFELSIAWDLSTMTNILNFSVDTAENTPNAVFFNNTGRKMYWLGQGNDDIREYNVGTLGVPGQDQPQSQSMNIGDTFNASWTINATGTNNTQWELGVLFNSSFGATNISEITTNNVTVCIGSCTKPTPPNVTISNPISKNHTTSSINFNVTALDETTVSSCWVTVDDGVTNFTLFNTTTTDDYNSTETVSDGNLVARFYCNDTANTINATESVNFTVDTTSPTTTATVTSPPGGDSYTFGTFTANNVKVTLDAVDALVGFDNLVYPRYCTDTANTCVPNTYISSGVTISTEGTSYIRYHSNDTLGNLETIQSGEIKIDTIFPDINITSPTNYTNTSNTGINVNFTSGADASSCWFSNDTFTKNITIGCAVNITNVTWVEGGHNVTIWANDSANNVNKSSVTFTIDTIAPEINITSPINDSNSSDTGLDVDYTFTEVNPDTCWYSNDTFAVNTTITCGTNITTIVWIEGNHNVTIWINDSVDQINKTDVTFNIDITPPDINISSPTNFTNTTDTGIDVEFITNNGANTCWFSNDTFTKNITIGCGNNLTNISWIEGGHNVTIWTNDSLGNENKSSVTFTIDTTAPTVEILRPVDLESFNTNTIFLNYSVSDSGAGLETCQYQNDSDPNITIACGTNTSINQGSDGTFTITVCANDTVGNTACDTNTWSLSTTSPATTLEFPAIGTWFTSGTDLTFNYTTSDSDGLDTCQLYSNWTDTWEVNLSNIHGGDSPINISNGNFTQTIPEGFFRWNVFCNDTGNAGSFALGNFTLGVDETTPLIEFHSSTPANDTNSTATSLFVNVTITETNPVNITFTLVDRSGVVNTSLFSMQEEDSNTSITFLSLPDEVYSYNVTIIDDAGNTNTTETRLRRLDDTAPDLVLVEPRPINYGDNNTVELNYSAVDNLIGLDECWFNVDNGTDTIISTTVLSSCQNTTFELPGGDIDYTLNLFSKDILDNTNSTTVIFGIRTESPVVVLSPTNDTHSNKLTDHFFNFTVTTNADNISNCSFHNNFNGSLFDINQTIDNPSESVNINFTQVNIPEGSFIWNVKCEDNLKKSGFALDNLTFVIDLTFPNITINKITPKAGFQTISFNSTEQDSNPTTCKYSIFDSNGDIDGANENVSYTCNSTSAIHLATASAFATFNLTIFTQDKAGNENSTTQEFTTSQIPAEPGGGGTVVTIIEGVIAIEAFNFTITATNLKNQIDISLARGSARPRKKQFLLRNSGIEPIEVEIICDTQNVNESSFNLSICDFVTFDQTSFTVSPNIEERVTGTFNIETPDGDVGFGDKFFFNILAVRTVGEEQRFSKLSVSSRISIIATLLLKWSRIPGFGQQSGISGEAGTTQGASIPTAPIALVLGMITFGAIFLTLRKRLFLTGFFGGIVAGIAVFVLLALFL